MKLTIVFDVKENGLLVRKNRSVKLAELFKYYKSVEAAIVSELNEGENFVYAFLEDEEGEVCYLESLKVEV